MENVLNKDELAVRKNLITKRLQDYGCKPTLMGFSILQDVILLSMQEPSLTCEELFSRYSMNNSEGFNEIKKNKIWKSSYRAAGYCLKQSMAPKSAVYNFIRECALSIEDTEVEYIRRKQEKMHAVAAI